MYFAQSVAELNLMQMFLNVTEKNTQNHLLHVNCEILSQVKSLLVKKEV